MKCFVMMPFGSNKEYDKEERESRIVYEKIIKPAVTNALGEKVQVKLESAKSETGSITASIIRSIAEADICIVDLTGRNANVFLELGVRYALKKKSTILMHQNSSDLPFDITSYRSFKYDTLEQDRFRDELCAYIRENIQSEHENDSLVFDVLADHREYRALAVSAERVMPWSDYFRRLEEMSDKLSEAKTDGRYRPDAIVGISNGGSMFADLLSMKAVHTEVVCSLWADRKSDNGSGMFDHPFNAGVVSGLLENFERLRVTEGDARILLVDDIVASSITFNAACNYLEDKMPKAHVQFLPFCFADQEKLEKVRSRLLWYHPAFGLDDDAVTTLHLTEFEKFPYNKPVRSA